MPQLVKLFHVTEVTLRKDLNALEKKGLLRRTHGGAVNGKVGLADFAHVCPLSQADIVVTDSPNDYLVRICQANETQLIVSNKPRN